jgi:hypothetical protein
MTTDPSLEVDPIESCRFRFGSLGASALNVVGAIEGWSDSVFEKLKKPNSNPTQQARRIIVMTAAKRCIPIM